MHYTYIKLHVQKVNEGQEGQCTVYVQIVQMYECMNVHTQCMKEGQ